MCLSFCLGGSRGAISAQAPVAPAAPETVAPAKPAALDPAAVAAKVDEYMQGQVKTNGFTGSILLAREGKPLVSKGYGYANAEWQIPNTSQTKFRVGLHHETVHVHGGDAAARAGEGQAGRLRLRLPQPLSRHLEVGHDPSPPDAHIGDPEYTGLAEWRKVHGGAKTVDEMIGFFRDLPLQWVPGEKFAYNNSGYFLLGAVIEKITGKKYEQVLREQIFAPLGNDRQRLRLVRHDYPAPRVRLLGARPPTVRNTAPLDMQQPYRRRLPVLDHRGPAQVGPGALHRPAAAGGGETDDVDAVQGELRVRLVDRAAVARDIRPSPHRARRRDQRLLEHDHPAA